MSPFWQTWWFELGVFISLVGSLLALYFNRIKAFQVQKMELERQLKQQTEQITHSVEAEARLCQELENARQEVQKANRAKTVFLATISHEMRTPLNGVIGMAALLKETSLNSEQQDYTDTIRGCGENLLAVINNLLDFSRLESGKMKLDKQDIDLRVYMEEVVGLFASQSAEIGLDLLYWIDPTVPAHIIADGQRLRQVLVNLVDNAIKFTREGEVFIKIDVSKTNSSDHLKLIFQVRDTGVGMATDEVSQLFQNFVQLETTLANKRGEMGLGLAICARLVELMGGKMAIESQPGQGTTLTFDIRVSKGMPSLVHMEPHTTAEMAGKQILIVDDNAASRYVLQNQLEQWTLVPTLADSGSGALAILSRKPHFDLVITDMVMPGMDGVRLAQIIKERYPKLAILLLSSVNNERLKRQSNLFSSVLTKPIKSQLLYNHLLHGLQLKQQPMKEVLEPSIVPQKTLSTSFSQRYPLRILIAEDNLVNQKLLAHILNKLGYQPGLALNGRAVLDAVSQQNYQVILMDVQMPEMDGLEATRLLRRALRQRLDVQPYIVATTANALPGDREECLQAGMDEYLSKPIQLEEIVKVLEKAALQLRNRP